jgi:hypothetical protein
LISLCWCHAAIFDGHYCRLAAFAAATPLLIIAIISFRLFAD